MKDDMTFERLRTWMGVRLSENLAATVYDDGDLHIEDSANSPPSQLIVIFSGDLQKTIDRLEMVKKLMMENGLPC